MLIVTPENKTSQLDQEDKFFGRRFAQKYPFQGIPITDMTTPRVPKIKKLSFEVFNERFPSPKSSMITPDRWKPSSRKTAMSPP